MKKTKTAAVYVRASTVEQDTDLQETGLRQYAESRGWKCVVYRDIASGTRSDRPALNSMLNEYTIGGASLGLQVGGSSSDFVLLLMDQKVVEQLLNGKTKMGADATAAAGLGATAAGPVDNATS